MEVIKVLQVNKLYYPETGGIEKVVQQISEGLNDQQDIDIKVLVCQKRGEGRTETVNSVQVHRSGSIGVIASVPISFSFIANLRKISKRYDIIQFHLPFPLGDLGCLLSGYKGKVVIYWHSDVVKQRYWMVLYRPIMEKFLQRADMILVSAKGIVKGSQYLKPYEKKCKVIPFAVDNRILYDGGRYLKEYGYKTHNTVTKFLFLGRLVYYKGCPVLLDAISKMKGEACFIIAGDGVLIDELKIQCKNLGISEQVKFLGHVSDERKRKCFEQADVFVLPSVERSEAFALVQLEAMAYGIPVINTNLPSGVPEVSIHGKTGLTVEPGDSCGLAKAMDWMVAHEERRIQMGMAARKRVEERYTQKLLIDNMRKVYLELLGTMPE